jgi:hypothetical protein
MLFDVMIMPNIGAARTATTIGTQWIYTAADRAADSGAGTTQVTISVDQHGTYGKSRATVLVLTL